MRQIIQYNENHLNGYLTILITAASVQFYGLFILNFFKKEKSLQDLELKDKERKINLLPT